MCQCAAYYATLRTPALLKACVSARNPQYLELPYHPNEIEWYKKLVTVHKVYHRDETAKS